MNLLHKIKVMMDMLVLMVTPACREIVQTLSDSLEEPVPWFKRFYIKPHLLCCPSCSRYLANIKTLRVLMQRYALRVERGESLALPGLSEDARRRIVTALRDRSSPE